MRKGQPNHIICFILTILLLSMNIQVFAGTVVHVTKVNLNKAIDILTVGGTDTLKATITPIKATNKAVRWTSSNATIAKVDGNGKVTSLKVGTATITVITADKALKATCKVTVNPVLHVSKVSLNKTKDILIVGGTDNLKATITPTNATNKAVKWTSSNATIAKVDANGKVIAVKAGTSTITVSTVDGSKKTTCIVTVSNPIINVTSVSLNKTIGNLTIGETDNLLASVNPTNANNKAVNWTSSNSAIAKVDSLGKVTTISAGTAIITVTTVNGSKKATYTVTVNNKKGYVYNTELQINLKVRSAPNLSGSILGYLYNYNKIEILDTIVDSSNNVWDKIIYNNGFAYVSDAYIQRYTTPPDNIVSIARVITKQFEVGTSNQVVGDFDNEGLSLGYLQWCIGQSTLQPILNRMDIEYNAEMKSIFGTNYNIMHSMILDTPVNQLKWAKSINNTSNNIINPWYSQFVSLCNNQDFKNIEADAEVYTVKQAMLICDNYKLKSVRGFALAFDIAVQNGSISVNAAKIINTALVKSPSITEKNLLVVIANAVADSSTTNSEDVRSRKIAIVNGKGIVHGLMFNLVGLSDSYWR